jgi:hypothetical protein
MHGASMHGPVPPTKVLCVPLAWSQRFLWRVDTARRGGQVASSLKLGSGPVYEWLANS